jgi:NTE family protein
MSERADGRTAIVFSGGGARGAYEAGVLDGFCERVLPRLPPGFEFDLVSGTSVGAIHAAYVAATSHLPPRERTRALTETWRGMRIRDVLQLSPRDLVGVPLRLLGASRLSRRLRSGAAVLGGLVDIAPLERIVAERIPWEHLDANLAARRPGALCVTCTQVRTGHAAVFMDGPLADPKPWDYDPSARALREPIRDAHVRASASIPFLFPAVRLGDRYYVDGGLRQNTPLAPPLRLRADRVVVIALKHTPAPGVGDEAPPYPEEVITQPVFLLGKVLDALMLDQLELDLHRMELVNSILARGTEVYGPDFAARINEGVREVRGLGFRPVEAAVLRPSEDVGEVAARCWERTGGLRALGVLAGTLTSLAQIGVPEDEADLLSYLYFDRSYTRELFDLGRQDLAAGEDDLLALLGAA